MRNPGTFRARAVGFLLALGLIYGLYHAVRSQTPSVVRALGPELLRRAEEALGREIQVEQFDYTTPGVIRLEGLKVSRGKRMAEGEVLSAKRAVLTYNPAFVALQTWLKGLPVGDTTARLEAEGVVVRQPEPLPPDVLLTTRTASARFDLRPLLDRKSDFLAGVSDVDLGGPVASLARDASGAWSFDKLLKSDTKKKPTTFRGVIRATDARLTMTDSRLAALPAPQRNMATGDVTARFGGFPVVEFSANARVQGSQGGTLRLHGHTDATENHRPTKPWFLSLQAESGGLAYWYHYFVRPAKDPKERDSFQPERGAGAARITLWSDAKTKDEDGNPLVRYRVGLELTDGAFRVKALGAPIQNVRGKVQVDPDLITVEARGTAAGVPATVTGNLLRSVPVNSRLRIVSDRVTLPALKRVLPSLELPAALSASRPASAVVEMQTRAGDWITRGTARIPTATYDSLQLQAAELSFETRVSGDTGAASSGKPASARSSAISGTLRAQRVRWLGGSIGPDARSRHGLTGRELRATYTLADGMAHAKGTLQTAGGTVRAQGWVDTETTPSRFYAAGRAVQLDLRQLPGAENAELQGHASGDFVASGSMDAPVVTAYARTGPIMLSGEPLDEVEGRVSWQGSTLSIQYGTLRQRGTRVALSGTIGLPGEGAETSQSGAAEPPITLDLRASARNVDLEELATGRVKEAARGQAWAEAHVTGSTDHPFIQGHVQVFKPEFRNEQADYLEAQLTANGVNAVQVSELKLTRASLTLTGERLVVSRPSPEDPWSVDGEFHLAGATLVGLARMAGMEQEQLEKLPVAGDLEPIRLGVHGAIGHPQLSFGVTSPRMTFAGEELGRVAVAGEARLEERVLALETLRSSSPTAQLQASGTVQWSEGGAESFAERVRLALNVEAKDVRGTRLLRRFAPDLLTQVNLRGEVERAAGVVTGTLSAPVLEGQVALRNLFVNDRVVEVEPFRIYASADGVVAREMSLKLGSGRLSARYLAFLNLGERVGPLLRAETSPERAGDWPLLPRIAGKLELRAIPVAVVRQLVEDSPFYASRSAEPIRETLSQWTAPLDGEVTASAEVALPQPVSGDTEPEAILAGLRLRRTPARLAGAVDVRELSLLADTSGAETTFSSRFDYQTGRLAVERFRLEQSSGAFVSATGIWDRLAPGGGVADFRVQAEDVKLTSLASLPIRGLRAQLAALEPLEGKLRLEGRVTGSPDQPQAQFSAAVLAPVVAGLPFAEVALDGGRYNARDGRLNLGELRLVRMSGSGGDSERKVLATARGYVELPWQRMGQAPRRSLNGTVREVTLEVPEQSLSVLTELANEADVLAGARSGEAAQRMKPLTDAFRQIAATEGTVAASVTLGGTDQLPNNQGWVRAQAKTLRLDGLQTEIKEFQAALRLEGDAVKVERFTGEGSRGGSFAGSGSVRLNSAAEANRLPTTDAWRPRLDLTLAVDRLRIAEKKLADVLGPSVAGSQADVTLQSVNRQDPTQAEALTIQGTWPSPRISGALRFNEASLLLAVQPVPGAPAAAPPIDARLNLTLLAGDKFWLRNPEARLRLTGGVTVTQTVSAPAVSGDLTVAEGAFNLPGLRLRNAEGTIKVNYDARRNELEGTGPSPVYVDLTAHASMQLRRATLESEYYDATFEIKGSPTGGGDSSLSGVRPASVGSGISVGSDSGLTLTVRTDPPLPSRDIEALIRQQFGVEGINGTGANVVETIRGQIEQALAANVATALTGRIEDRIQAALGLDIFSIDLGVQQPLRIRLGKRLFGQLYGTISQQFNVSAPSERRLELYYRLTPTLRIGYRQEQPFNRTVFFLTGARSF